MKVLSTVLALVSATFVVGQTTTSSSSSALPSGVPLCAISCATLFLNSNGQCGSSDTACLCNSSSFQSSAASCIVDNCSSSSDQQSAYNYAASLCSSAGVTLPSFSQLVSNASSSAAASSTKTASSTSTSTATTFTSDARQKVVGAWAFVFGAGLAYILI